jgi:hypothetical protein
MATSESRSCETARRRAGSPRPVDASDSTEGAAGHRFHPAVGSRAKPYRRSRFRPGAAAPSRGRADRNRERGGDPWGTTVGLWPQRAMLQLGVPRTHVQPRRILAETPCGPGIRLRVGRDAGNVEILALGRGWVPRQRTEGRGCDTVRFGNRYRDAVFECGNPPDRCRSCLRRAVRVALLRHRGGCHRWWRIRDRRRIRGRTSGRDRISRSRIISLDTQVGPDELAGADPEPGDRARVRNWLGGRSGRLASANSAPPGLRRAGFSRIGAEGRHFRGLAGQETRVRIGVGREINSPGHTILPRARVRLGAIDAGDFRRRCQDW